MQIRVEISYSKILKYYLLKI